MADLSFDDLIPAKSGKTAPSVSFDDLLPQTQQFDAMGNPTGGTEAAAPASQMPYKEQMQHAGQYADDLVRQAANGATFGGADKLAGYMNGSGTQAERTKTQEAHARTGYLGDAANFGGSLIPAGAIGKGVGALAGAAESVPLIGRMLANPWVQAGTEGATYGGLDAAGHDHDIGTGMAIGGVAGLGGKAVADALLGGVSKVAGLANDKPAIPSTDALKSASQAAYKASEDAGVIATPDATQRLAQNIKQQMADFGYSPYQQPGGQAVLGELARLDGQNTTLKGLETLRKVAGRMRTAEGDEGVLGSKIVNQIDDFTSKLGPQDILGGDAQTAVQGLQKARSLWQRAAKASDMEDAMAAAHLRAGSTGSGGNVDNATRQEARKLLQSRSNWTADERDALTKVAMGTPTQNALRLVGKLSPEGNGLMLALHGLATLPTAGMNWVTALGGYGAKKTADAMTQNNARYAAELMRSGGNAAALQPAQNTVQRFAETKRDALAKALMRLGTGQEGQGPFAPAPTGGSYVPALRR